MLDLTHVGSHGFWNFDLSHTPQLKHVLTRVRPNCIKSLSQGRKGQKCANSTCAVPNALCMVLNTSPQN